jgi:Fic family protein
MDIYGHAKAIEYLYDIVSNKENLTEEKLFEIHRLVQKNMVHDIYKPTGAWKIEPNGTYVADSNGGQRYIEYPSPDIIPALMGHWIEWHNATLATILTREKAPLIFVEVHTSFVRIHPFYDGNGRVARLVANMSLLRSGLPPLLIQKEQRREYIHLLAEYEQQSGPVVSSACTLLPQHPVFDKIVEFCAEQWKTTWELIDKANEIQTSRDRISKKLKDEHNYAGLSR